MSATTWLVVVLPVVAMGVGGCNRSHTRFKHPRFMSEADCAACLQVALDAESPDARREAVVHIARTSRLTSDIVVRALIAITRTDRRESVRLAAVRALAKAGVPGAIEPLIEIVSAPDETGVVSDPRAGAVRRAALEGLAALMARDELSDEQREVCHATAIRLLNRHRSRDVRIAAAGFLRHFPVAATLTALIDALEQRDFGVVYQSERSLMHLTGRTFDHDAAAWRRGLAAVDDPFEHAGRLDHELCPKEESWWARTIDGTRQVFAGFRPK